MNPSAPYLFIEIYLPRKPRYREGPHAWSNVVGDLIKPWLSSEGASGHIEYPWWVQEGSRHFQVCFATTVGPSAYWERQFRSHCHTHGFRVKRVLIGTVGGALGGTRWCSKRLIAKSRKVDWGKAFPDHEAFRSERVLRAISAVCLLYVDTLVKRRGDWVVEAPADTRQNPHSSLFESFVHLVANTTEFRFDVQLIGRTGWMNPTNGAQADYVCRAKLEGLHL